MAWSLNKFYHKFWSFSILFTQDILHYQNFLYEQDSEAFQLYNSLFYYINENSNNLDTYKFKRKKIDEIVINFKKGLPVLDNQASIETSKEIEKQNSRDKTELVSYITYSDGFYFQLPASDDLKKDIKLTDYTSMIVNGHEIVNSIIENLDKATNSFIGISSGRIVIQEVEARYGTDSLLILSEITTLGDMLLNNIKYELIEQHNIIKVYADYFDECYLYLVLQDMLYEIQILPCE